MKCEYSHPVERDEPHDMPPVTPGVTDPSTRIALLTLGLGLVGFLGIGGPAQMLNLSWGLLFTEVFIFLGVPWVLIRLHRQNPLVTTTLNQFSPRLLGYGLLIGTLNFFAWGVPTIWGAQKVLPQKIVELFDGSVVFQNQTPVELAFIMLGVSVAAPICEEFFFRGTLQRMLPMERPAALVLTAFIFSMMHLDPVGFVTRFELGVVFGLLAWRFNSIWAGIGAHVAHNSVSSILYFLGDEQSEDQLDWWVVVIMFMIGNALLAVAIRAGRSIAAAQPPHITEESASSNLRIVAPWLAGALLSVATIVAVDWRGVQLGLIDATLFVQRPLRSGPVEQKSQWDELMHFRAQARSGEITIDRYRQHRQALHKD